MPHSHSTKRPATLIKTPRRCPQQAIFCACLALAFGVEIVVFSPARRASRKLLERIVEFVNLAGGSAKICEYNQEACRINSFDGKKSLVRSFPSKVAVRRGLLKRGNCTVLKRARPSKRPSIPMFLKVAP